MLRPRHSPSELRPLSEAISQHHYTSCPDVPVICQRDQAEDKPQVSRGSVRR